MTTFKPIRAGEVTLDRITFHTQKRDTGETVMTVYYYQGAKRTLKRVPVDVTRDDAQKAYQWLRSQYVRELVVGEVEEAVYTTASHTPGKLSPDMSFADFADEWTSGRLHARYPDRVGAKDSKDDVCLLKKHINPYMGRLRISSIGLRHLEDVMDRLPKDLAPATRRHVAQCMSKVVRYAYFPAKVLESNPVPHEGFLPKVKNNKAKSYLFPDEDKLLLGQTKIDIDRRIAYGLLAREGMRLSELGNLKWRDVDLKRGFVKLDYHKTIEHSEPRMWKLSEDVIKVLKWWKERTKGQADEYVCRFYVHETHCAKNFREDLETAGVDRPELFTSNAHRLKIRVHDLRASFVTLSLANGKTNVWVSDRTGHSLVMIERYDRAARTAKELNLGYFGDMSKLLPEMRKR